MRDKLEENRRKRENAEKGMERGRRGKRMEKEWLKNGRENERN